MATGDNDEDDEEEEQQRREEDARKGIVIGKGHDAIILRGPGRVTFRRRPRWSRSVGCSRSGFDERVELPLAREPLEGMQARRREVEAGAAGGDQGAAAERVE